MKRCLYIGCGLANVDSAEVCRSCGLKSFQYIDDEALKSQVPPGTIVESEPQVEPQPDEKETKGTHSEDRKRSEGHSEDEAPPKDHKPPKDQKPPEVRQIDRIKVKVSQGWLWSKEQLKSPLIGGFVGVVSLVLAFFSAPQLLYLWNHFTNNAPVIRNVMASQSVIQLGEEVTLTAWADDVEEGTSVSYQWAQSAGAVLGNGPVVTLSTAGMERSSASSDISVTLTVIDSQHVQSKPYSVAIRISNSKPRLKSIEPDKMAVRVGEPVKLIAIADDPGGDRSGKLHYEWHCPVGQIDRYDYYKTTLQTAGLDLRSAPIYPKVRVTVTNDRGESTEGEITLSITPAVRKVYRPKKNQPATTTTLIIGVKEPLTLDSKTAPQPQTSPAPQSSKAPPEAPSPADSSKQITKPPP